MRFLKDLKCICHEYLPPQQKPFKLSRSLKSILLVGGGMCWFPFVPNLLWVGDGCPCCYKDDILQNIISYNTWVWFRRLAGVQEFSSTEWLLKETVWRLLRPVSYIMFWWTLGLSVSEYFAKYHSQSHIPGKDTCMTHMLAIPIWHMLLPLYFRWTWKIGLPNSVEENALPLW